MAGLTPTCDVFLNQEEYLHYGGLSLGARDPDPHQTPAQGSRTGKKSPCKEQQGLWLRDMEATETQAAPLPGPVHRQQHWWDQGHMGKNWTVWHQAGTRG